MGDTKKNKKKELLEMMNKERRKKDSDRQAKVTEKRNNEGLKLVKLYLDEQTVSDLEALAKRMGYDLTSSTSAGKIEVLSKVASHCIRSSKSGKEDTYTNHKLTQELYQVQQIVKARSKGTSKKGFGLAPQSPSRIVSFMKKGGYRTPDKISDDSSKQPNWLNDDIAFCLNDTEFTEYMNELDQKLKNKSTNKKKNAKPRS